MLETLSVHYETVTTSLGKYLTTHGHSHHATALNVGLLEKTLDEHCSENAISAGGKRPLEQGSPRQTRKRTKLSNGAHTTYQPSKYPSIPPPKRLYLDGVYESDGQETVAVLRHVQDVRYSGLTPEKHPRLMELLEKSQTTTLELGPVELAELDGRVVASGEEWLMVVPQVKDGVDAEDDDYTTPSVDLILSCSTLARAGKVTLEASASLLVEDSSSFHIQLKIVVSLCLPHIFHRLVQKESKRNFDLVEQAQRRLLSLIYTPNPGEGNHAVNIPYFYSILQSAPALPTVVADDAMQPDLLNPTLLPFQRRSVGWLLHREGMDVTPQGEVVRNPSLEEFSFWTPVSEGNHTWHYNQLNGALMPSQPEELPVALGGVLAEEPGLGKTLEMISLILLHPPDDGRNPTVTRWDPEARLDVKAVKTSLIVTPPALAAQWVDEIAAHAPTLKVLVYDGWSKVKVPITRTKVEEERARQAVKDSESEKKRVALEKAKAAKSKSKARQSKGKVKEPELPADSGPDLTRDAEGNLLEWCDFVQQYDVVITTYQVLRLDFNVARAPPVRPRREDAKYVNMERPRSPLVMVEWNRVIMDEVQMVGGAKLADMVSLIPRLSSYAVSGTPARAEVADLIHVVKFLRVFDVIGSERLWRRLIKPGFAHLFAQFIQNYSIRTTKASVKLELTIPQQTRYLVPISLGKVEQHVYDQTLETILLELGLDARGVAASEGWDVDAALLRTSIRRLRGICTHPQVGQLLRKGDVYKKGALKSMDEVLENMRDQNWKNIMEDWKAKVQLTVRYGQLIQQNDQNARARDIALETFQGAEKDINAHIKEIDTILADHRAKGETLKQEAATARRAQAEAKALKIASSSGPPLNIAGSSTAMDKGKGKAREEGDSDVDDEDSDDEDEENVEDKGLPKTPAGKEHRARTQALKSRLREAKLILHKIKFLMGDLFHNLGRNEDEDKAYEDAEGLRKGLLRGSEEDASRAMAQLDEDLTRKRFDARDLKIPLPYLGKGGIRSADLMEEANELIENVLNEQSKLLIEWRAKIVGLLTQKLTGKESDDEQGDGQEYQRNLDNQGEAEVYMQAYAALLADRREALVNERTLLAAHDVREKKLRHTKAAMKAAQAFEEASVMVNVDDVELQPEHEVMYKGLSDQRKELLQELHGRAIKSIMVDLNAILQRLTQARDEPERVIVTKAVANIRRLMSTQNQLHDKLDADLVLIRKAFNERILYFRQLQEISDSVAVVTWEHDTLNDAIEDCLQERTGLEGKINTNRARHRYLVNLVDNKGVMDDDEEDEENVCILCRCDFLRGFITQCAHIFCEGCMKAWLQRREGKTCPVCRVAIDPDSVQRFTVNNAEAEAPKQPVDGQAAPQSTRKIEYNFIDSELFGKIEKMESLGDFGSKIQTLVRHLLHLQTEDPGAKSIVFSAWADSLHIVEWALHSNGIRCLRIDQKSKGESAAKKFRTDPDILVLLLHGERENAGLNVTCASRVFLLESVVHHSFEIQAIARIDRMGQTRPTEVYCYYAEDTVERNILDLAARKGLSLYTKDKAAGTLDTTSFSQESEKNAIDAPAKKKTQKGDFIFKIDDMLAVLFPHMYEDVEYLIPEDELGRVEDVEMADVTTPSSNAPSDPRPPTRVQENAEAGPSRLAR